MSERSASVFESDVDQDSSSLRQAAPGEAIQVTPSEYRRAVRLQARRVRRVIRHIEPWSAFKVSLLFYFCLWLIVLLSSVLLWSFAVGSGTIDSIESFIEELFALQEFKFNAGQMFRGLALGGLLLVVSGTFFNVLLCVLFNLISELVGGLRFTVIEEETARPRLRRKEAGPIRRQGRILIARIRGYSSVG